MRCNCKMTELEDTGQLKESVQYQTTFKPQKELNDDSNISVILSLLNDRIKDRRSET